MLGVRVVSLGLLDGRHLGSHGHTRNKKTIAERIFSKFITINVMVMATSEVRANFVMIRARLKRRLPWPNLPSTAIRSISS